MTIGEEPTNSQKVQKLQAALHAKAKESPAFRFYALYDKVYRQDVLHVAFRQCRSNDGRPGVDGQTFEQILDYGVERWLEELAEELRTKRYQPQAVRRVWIPKPDGKQRPLGIPTIRDRVVQTALLLVLEPIFEADLPAEQYVPHLKHLQALHRMATCTGMELTGNPLPINHQNALPLHHHPHTQDGGGPVTSTDPVTQVERLAFWDNKRDKLVQMNHPNLPQILGDRDLDGQPDQGFERMFGFVDVIEVHPPQDIFQQPQKGTKDRNAIFHWMQMLNLGYHLPGVMNTDSHYNYHESGFFRNFIRSSQDDPAQVDVMEMAHNSEHGRVVVSSGPFMTVTARAGGGPPVGPGEDLVAPDGRVELAVRVQCPNWFDINRVQVFINGRPNLETNFTRRTNPHHFSDRVVRFEAKIPVELKTDAHLIVATIGENLELGPVLGPEHGKKPPAAVANPIFVDVDSGGFKPNGDLLGVPLALDTNRPITKPMTK